MKIDLTDTSPVKKSLAIEVEPHEMERETEVVLRGYAKKAKIPGFRPGKAPLTVIRARFGDEVREEVRERVMTRCFREAAREKELRPLGDPILDEVHEHAGEPFRFRVTFEVLPELDVKDYKGIELRRPKVEVGPNEVEAALEELRQAQVQLLTEEGRAATTGDVVVCDLSGSPADGEPFSREGALVEVGDPHNPPTFNDRLEGAQAGVHLEFPVDYPAEFENPALAGKSVRYDVRVHEVKVKRVPELDDEFAKDLGDFETLDALRTRVRDDIEARKQRDAERQLRQSLLDKVLMQNPVVLPEALVENELRHRLEELVRRLMMQGVNPEQVDLDWKKLRDQQDEPARKAVHARLVLDAVARREGIAANDEEVDERIRRDAESMGEKFTKLRAKVREQGGIEALKNQLVREKSLDLMIAVANIQNEE